jgi:hypothetical protein
MFFHKNPLYVSKTYFQVEKMQKFTMRFSKSVVACKLYLVEVQVE